MPRFRGIVASSLTVAIISISCANLPSVRAGTCGNGVVEAEAGEECDSFAAAGSACRAPGTTGQCRFDCGADPSSASNALYACPAGFACGTGSVCRVASGAFVAAPGLLPAADALGMKFADFDGDGRMDLLTESADDVRVHYFDGSLALASTLRIAIPHARAAVGQLTPDSLADLVLTSVGGVDVLRGRSDRTLAPTVYPSFPIPGSSVRMVAIEALPANPGVELFVVGGLDATSAGIGRVASKRSDPVPMFLLPALPDQFAGEILTASFIETLPCQQLALAIKTESKVRVFSSCRPAAGGVELNAVQLKAGDPPQKLLPDVQVPGKVTALRAGRVNGDAHVDLLINTSNAVYIAYGVGDGTFHSSATVPASSGDGAASLFPITIDTDPRLAGFPLAIGDLNGDGLGDLVLPNAVVFNRGDGIYTASAIAPQTWTTARIVDLNGNRLPDVVAASDTAIDFYNGTLTFLLNHTSYTPGGAVGFLQVGDVDGDLVNDIVFRQSTTDTTGGAPADDLAIMFGHSPGFPDPPVVIGRLPLITEIVVTPFESSLVNEDAPADGIADVGVLSKNSDQTLVVAALQGRADRQLTSPFFLVDAAKLTERGLVPSQFATGAFTSRSHTDVASIAFEPSADGKSLSSRLWIAPLSGDAVVDTNGIKPTADVLSAALDFDRAQLVAVDLDDPASATPDELVAIAPPIAGSGGPGALYVARLQGGAWVAKKVDFGSGPFREWRIASADVNGDGAKDIVVLYGDQGARKAMVLWNRRNGELDPNGAALTMPTENVTGFACFNADRDPQLEIALVTSKAVYLAKLEGESFPGAPAALAGVTGGVTIAAGDADGDGVADLAIGGSRGVQVFAGVAALR